MLEFLKKNVVKFASVLALSTGLAVVASTPAKAQEKLPAAKVAIVNIDYVLAKSETWQNAQKDIQVQLEQIRGAIDAKRNSIAGRIEELKRQQTILAPDVYQQKARELQKERLTLQREAQNSRGEVNKVLANMRLQLRGVITQIASKVANDKGMNIGFDVGTVLFFKDGMNITEEVLKRFNATKTKVEVTGGKKK